MKRRLVFVGLTLLLAGMACAITDLAGGFTEPTLPPPPPPAQPAGQCDSRTTPIQTGTAYSGRLNATSDPYPANCAYYCLWASPGTGTLSIGLSGFEVDLDLYVGYGEYSAVFGQEVTAGETYDWKSNEYGTDDELVTISNPPTDAAYYIEICSFKSLASDFQLQATAQ